MFVLDNYKQFTTPQLVSRHNVSPPHTKEYKDYRVSKFFIPKMLK